jgi:Xaa-Pro aminopeptidase
MQVFPKGTEGARLDGITRACLWSNGLDYGHGTGHGVGAYLNVHEGPQGIHRMASEPLIPGMVLSIEPGYYRPGWGGIRHENLYSVVEIPPDRVPSPFGSLDKPWYGFDVLTLIPFDPQPILWPLLSDDHKHWLKAYHRKVWEKHEGHLDPATRQWLARICEPYIAI